MIALPVGTRLWLAAGVTDMRRGMYGLAALVENIRYSGIGYVAHLPDFNKNTVQRISRLILYRERSPALKGPREQEPNSSRLYERRPERHRIVLPRR